ncbi:SRPBCC family protein [Streptomyces sp. 1331.2]|uniref:SRPBCC family protein n=1 Tax=Streptomyces sp. 1331.2 TaxID=1938835 RepID=UPI000BC91EA7|nr:SRPBCC family protein [Streptomyces sp. 1331.2]SOB85963.1 Polyketide cyclase / dehydrase and lipid transport [Streptomyces sp. 1331.2]
MGRIEESVEIAAPRDEVYERWVRCEEFPQFMRGVVSVDVSGPGNSSWVVVTAGGRREFEAVTTEVVEGERVAWDGGTGPVRHSGVVTFHRVDDRTTRVMLQLEIEPHGLWEHLVEALGFVDRRVIDDLNDFKHHVERAAAGPASSA